MRKVIPEIVAYYCDYCKQEIKQKWMGEITIDAEGQKGFL